MKLRLVRLNPLMLDPGELVLMAARQLAGGVINQFPVRLEATPDRGVGEFEGNWEPVEFINEFLTDENNDAREVRTEVQVPVYYEPARNVKPPGPKGD